LTTALAPRGFAAAAAAARRGGAARAAEDATANADMFVESAAAGA
jgi:hypothetical protein